MQDIVAIAVDKMMLMRGSDRFRIGVAGGIRAADGAGIGSHAFLGAIRLQRDRTFIAVRRRIGHVHDIYRTLRVQKGPATFITGPVRDRSVGCAGMGNGALPGQFFVFAVNTAVIVDCCVQQVLIVILEGNTVPLTFRAFIFNR